MVIRLPNFRTGYSSSTIFKWIAVQRTARGEATSSSDLDFRVDKGALKGLFALGGLYSDLEESFDKDLDLLTTGSLEPDFLNLIANEEILIYNSFNWFKDVYNTFKTNYICFCIIHLCQK